MPESLLPETEVRARETRWEVISSQQLGQQTQYRDIVNQCRWKLLTWLIGSSRVCTLHAGYVYADWPDGGDGKLPAIRPGETMNYL